MFPSWEVSACLHCNTMLGWIQKSYGGGGGGSGVRTNPKKEPKVHNIDKEKETGSLCDIERSKYRHVEEKIYSFDIFLYK